MNDKVYTLRVFKLNYHLKREDWNKKYSTYSEEPIFNTQSNDISGNTVGELVENIIKIAAAHTYGQFKVIYSRPYVLSASDGFLEEAKNLNPLEKMLLKRELKKRLMVKNKEK